MAESAALILPSPEETAACGAALADALLAQRPGAFVIYLEGELGAGKTTWARGFLHALGHRGRVPSPTYTLIEPYELGGLQVYHLDLYRIREARELAELGLAEQLAGAVALVEWPDHGRGFLPAADLHLHLRWRDDGRQEGREFEGTPRSSAAAESWREFRRRWAARAGASAG